MTKPADTITPDPIDVVVPKQASGTRLDRFLADHLAQFSRSRLQQLIRSGAVTLNAKSVRPRDVVRTGDAIRIVEPATEPSNLRSENIPLEVLFEDDDLIVLNKPAGLVVHPGAGHQEHTLVNALLGHCRSLSAIGGEERPGIVHRLDKDTSGCMVVAKNDETHRALSTQFADRTVKKVYLALVAGKLRKNVGSIDANIGRHPVHRQRMSVNRIRGRAARTDYNVLASANGISLVECQLHSGRTHQIRVHLHHIGHPVVGDKLYGRKTATAFDRQMLHAWKLGFQHPKTGQWKEFQAPVPQDFRAAIPDIKLA
ncbi:MAG: RluA family pseudouridine synthase [Chthoniobacterales bacterium]